MSNESILLEDKPDRSTIRKLFEEGGGATLVGEVDLLHVDFMCAARKSRLPDNLDEPAFYKG
jgi:hypothetical protein